MRILTIVGARPQFIKASTVSRAIVDYNHKAKNTPINEVMVHTGQHFDTNMSKVFFDELKIPEPNYNLGIGGGSHGQNTGRMLEKVEAIMISDKPDMTLVYGDTDSTLAGALASVKLHIPVAHVEAGLRSFNRKMPEEINRILTDHLASLLFTPTDRATANLQQEGIDGNRVCQVGDVMYDAASFYGTVADRNSRVLENLALERDEYVLSTVHRAENTDNPDALAAIIHGLGQVAKRLTVVWPLHPRTAIRLKEFDLSIPKEIRVIDPIGYIDMVKLEKNAAIIVTDSGGVQKEAYFSGIPCVTLRHETEWLELLDLGWNHLAPPLSSDIAQTILGAVGTKGKMGIPYGKGNAAQRITEILAEALPVAHTIL